MVSIRLYALEWLDNAGPDFDVEAWWGLETLSRGFEYIIDLLSLDAHLVLETMIGRAVSLRTALSDGSSNVRTGLIRIAWQIGTDGGFARYRIVVVPWIWRLSTVRHNRVFQEQSVIEIVESVFADYPDIAAWQWCDEVADFMADTRLRSYCVQYDESDYAFVTRLLSEEGIGWRIEEAPEAQCGHRLSFFADSRLWPEDTISQSATGGLGIRFHRADAQEDQDSVLAFTRQRTLLPGKIAAVGFDYKAKQLVAQTVPTQRRVGGEHAPFLECFDDGGLYPWATTAEAERYGRLAMEALEARDETWSARSSVRSLRAGTRIDLIDLPTQPGGSPEGRYGVLSVLHAGINNLASESMADIAERLARNRYIAEVGRETIGPVAAPPQPPADLLALAVRLGYGNRFTALAAHLPWRPWLRERSVQSPEDSPITGHPLARRKAPGSITAIVVGPEGETAPQGNGEVWCDALGRIKLRFQWQADAPSGTHDSCWIRATARQAGPGMGWQWLPRIGQELDVGFMAGNIDRPIVLAALFNGHGEGGVPLTPGGDPGESETAAFAQAADHRPAAQGNLADGNAPAWHAAAPSEHRHAAALSGFKSKEFGGAGHSQLVFDDSDEQLRIQLKTTQHASELNLGHLIHQADNYRGSFRGTGAELRTDAWGALRAAQGIAMTTWPATAAQAAGDMAPATALLRQAETLADSLSQAAAQQRTLPLGTALGGTARGQSHIDPEAAPLPALRKLASGQVDARDESTAKANAGQKQTNYAAGETLPHLTDPALLQAARGGIAQIAGQHLQIASGESIAFIIGGDSDWFGAGQARFQAGQGIGITAAAIQAPNQLGLQIIAASGDIRIEAQSDEIKWQARDQIKLVSANRQIDLAAGKKVYLAVAGGASIAIDGNITVACPGSMTIHASKRHFTGPTRISYSLPSMPKNSLVLKQDFPVSL